MIISLSTLETILRTEDLEGLLALGAPHDEYFDEASDIQVALQALSDGDVTADRVSDLVAGIWEQAFGPFSDDDVQARRPVLQKIVNSILEEHYRDLGSLGSKADTRIGRFSAQS